MNSLAYAMLQASLLRAQGPRSALRAALAWDVKGKVSPVFYILGIALALVHAWFGLAAHVIVALIWMIP